MTGLQDLGLSAYEADVYATLLDEGSSTAKTLSREADVPLGRVYDVVDHLEEKRLVRVDHDMHPKRITAVDPDVAIDRLVEDKRSEVAAEVERFEQAADVVREEFERTGVVVGEEFVTTAIGPDEAFDLLLERYASASDELLLGFREPPASVITDGSADERPPEVLERLLDRGVTIRMLLAEDALTQIPAERRATLAEFVTDHDLSVRLSDSLRRTVAIIDEVEICLEERMPASNDLFALVDLRNARFARTYREELLKLWTQAHPTPLG